MGLADGRTTALVVRPGLPIRVDPLSDSTGCSATHRRARHTAHRRRARRHGSGGTATKWTTFSESGPISQDLKKSTCRVRAGTAGLAEALVPGEGGRLGAWRCTAGRPARPEVSGDMAGLSPAGGNGARCAWTWVTGIECPTSDKAVAEGTRLCAPGARRGRRVGAVIKGCVFYSVRGLHQGLWRPLNSIQACI